MASGYYAAGYLTNADLRRLSSIQRALDSIYNDSGLLTAAQRDRILIACSDALEHYNQYYYGRDLREIQKHLEKVKHYASIISNELYWLMMRIEKNPYLTSDRKRKYRKHIHTIQKAMSNLKARKDGL
jgi:hypothetical protein